MTSAGQDEERPSAAELAESIARADRPSPPQPKEFRFIWNVPPGVQPYVPLWFSLLVIGLLVFAVLG
ncbi:MAG: hypothetical protein ABR614_01210 [Mycobacteriales bacterium]